MRIKYRPEIDGLRTIAVMLVIFHHLGWSLFSGGYIGVDVFFVISGYLITSIISSEILNKKFSIKSFYKRRILRLAPAYFLVIFSTSIAALIFMLPRELLNYVESALYATFFSANFYMWSEVGGYFGSQSEVVPLLHLWTLAVEEQFYILWPLALLTLFSLFNKRLILFTILLSIVFGVYISEWGVQNYRAAAYYLLPTRFFELLIGALLVFLPKLKEDKALIAGFFVGCGILLIFYSAFYFSVDQFFPGYSAIIPCLGTALVIYFSRTEGRVERILTFSPMVYLGRISYPAYLWHWPIIAFCNLLLVNIDWKIGFGIVLLTLILSSFTFHYVESFFYKNKKSSFLKILGFGFLLPASVVVSGFFIAHYFNGFPNRFNQSLNIKSEALNSYTYKVRGRCNEGPVNNPLPADKCILGLENKDVDFLLVGDSHANHFTSMIDVLAKDAGVRGYDITQSNTIYLPGVRRFYDVNGESVEHKHFLLRNNTLDKIVKEGKYKAVILGGSFATHYNGTELVEEGLANDDGEAFEKGFYRALRNIYAAGSKAIVIKGNPYLADTSYDCSIRNERFNKNENCNFNIEKHNANFYKWNDFLIKMKNEFPELILIKSDQIFCKNNICTTEIDGVPLYRDNSHLNDIGSKLLGEKYLEFFGNPLSVLSDSLEKNYKND